MVIPKVKGTPAEIVAPLMGESRDTLRLGCAYRATDATNKIESKVCFMKIIIEVKLENKDSNSCFVREFVETVILEGFSNTI
jgi:hypothetical protein